MGAVAEYLSNASPEELDSLNHMGQPQKEALLEVIVLAMYADGQIALEELDMIGRVAAELPPFVGVAEQELQRAMSGAIKKVEGIADVDAATRFLEAIGERLQTRVLREIALGAAIAVSYADGVVPPAEQNFLKDLIKTLEIAPDRAQAIINEIKEYVVSPPS